MNPSDIGVFGGKIITYIGLSVAITSISIYAIVVLVEPDEVKYHWRPHKLIQLLVILSMFVIPVLISPLFGMLEYILTKNPNDWDFQSFRLSGFNAIKTSVVLTTQTILCE